MQKDISGARGSLRLWTLLLGSTMTVMAGAAIAPALPQMLEVFKSEPHADLAVKLLLSIHALFIAITAPVIGVFMDKWGRKPVLIGTVILYGLAGSSGFYLGSLLHIMIGRVFLGIAVAGIMSGFTTLIGDYYSGERLNRVMGMQAAFAGFGGLLFLSASGVLADMGWRFPFLIYLFAFLVLPGVLFFLDDAPRTGPETGPTLDSGEKDNPLPQLLLIYAVAFLGMLLFYLVPVQLPYRLKNIPGVTNTQVGVALGLMNLVGALSSMQFRKIKSRLSHQRVAAVFAFFMGAGYVTLYFAHAYAVVLMALVVAGIGFGLLMPNVNVWIVSLVPQSLRGKAVGGLTTFFLLGQFVSPIVAQPFVGRYGVAPTFGAAGILLVLMAAIFLVLPGKKLS